MLPNNSGEATDLRVGTPLTRGMVLSKDMVKTGVTNSRPMEVMVVDMADIIEVRGVIFLHMKEVTMVTLIITNNSQNFSEFSHKF